MAKGEDGLRKCNNGGSVGVCMHALARRDDVRDVVVVAHENTKLQCTEK